MYWKREDRFRKDYRVRASNTAEAFTGSLWNIRSCLDANTVCRLTHTILSLSLNFCVRELAFQIAEQFAVLGAPLNLRTAVVVGGIDMMAQALELGNRPHVVVATPGRIVDLLKSTSGEWDLSRIKFLVCSYTLRAKAVQGIKDFTGTG